MLESLTTEQPNPDTEHLDTCSAIEIVTLMNDAEKTVPIAVEMVLPAVAKAVDGIAERLKFGGRLFYVGAGTSGRLGILDATECPPTFGTPPERVQFVMAGGRDAVFEAVENAEDDEAAGAVEVTHRGIGPGDAVVGLAASGRTPFVIGALQKAKEVGAFTIGVSCNLNSVIGKVADVAIDMDTGPEVLMGSTRLKAGTAQKMVLNMISTASMVKLGKVYKNMMVDLKVTNQKLVERARRTLMAIAEVDSPTAERLLKESGGHVKTAIVMAKRGVNKATAEGLLEEADGFLREALGAGMPD